MMTERLISDPVLCEIEVALDAKAFPTGSRVICPGAVSDSSYLDYMFFVMSLKHAVKTLEELGFATFAYTKDDFESYQFLSLRRGLINVLLTASSDFFEDFKLATRVATKLGLTHKDDRVTLFQAILYGNG